MENANTESNMKVSRNKPRTSQKQSLISDLKNILFRNLSHAPIYVQDWIKELQVDDHESWKNDATRLQSLWYHRYSKGV